MTHYLLRSTGDLEEMSTLTMRYMRGYFVVTAPDIEPVMFKSRREARDWCAEHHPVTDRGSRRQLVQASD